MLCNFLIESYFSLHLISKRIYVDVLVKFFRSIALSDTGNSISSKFTCDTVSRLANVFMPVAYCWSSFMTLMTPSFV